MPGTRKPTKKAPARTRKSLKPKALMLHVRATHADRRAIKALSLDDGLTMSAWIHRAIQKEIAGRGQGG